MLKENIVMKNWIGNWFLATATIHTIFAIGMFQDTWIDIIQNGIFNTIGDNFQRGAVVFFFFWGLLFFVLALVVKDLEKNNIRLPKILGVGLFLHAIIAIIFVPESGYWLLFPPAISILLRDIKNKDLK